MTWKAKTAASWPGSDVFSAWPPWTTGPFLKVLENNAAVLQLEAVVPQGTSWRDFHAFVGRYHKSQFETAVGDLGMLRAAWESAAEVSLPYAAWLCIAEVQLEETF